MYRKFAGLFLVLALSVSVIAACGDDDDDDDDDDNGDASPVATAPVATATADGDEATRQEVIDFMTTLASIDGNTASDEQIEYWLAHVTDSFVQGFGVESVDACRANAPECIGEPLPNPRVDPDTVMIEGDSATLVLESDAITFGIGLIRDGDEWKADRMFVPNDDIPAGTEVVELGLAEFAFNGDLESPAVTSGDFAFHVTNEGQQDHELVLVALPEGRPIEELVQDESFQPEPILVRAPYEPGDESDVALPAPLEPGRYGLVCFLPDTDDPEGTPHAFKGMVAEFTVE